MKQSLDEESIIGLVNYRIERSIQTLSEAKLMLDEGCLNGAINRLYYACLLSFTSPPHSCVPYYA